MTPHDIVSTRTMNTKGIAIRSPAFLLQNQPLDVQGTECNIEESKRMGRTTVSGCNGGREPEVFLIAGMRVSGRVLWC